MARGRKTALTIRLAADERHTLMAWQRSTTIPAGRARRGRIILLVADGVPISHLTFPLCCFDQISCFFPKRTT